MVKKIGVLTSGGDCPGLNAALRAIVKTAMIKYGYQVLGFKDGYKGLVRNNFVRFRSDDVSGILDKGGTILGTSSNDDPFCFYIDKDGDGVFECRDMSDTVIENISMHSLDCLIVVGNNKTMEIACKLADKGVKIICIPSNVDNEVGLTDTSFGFMSAVETVSDAIDRLHSSAEAQHRVMILEVTGSLAGWVALEAGISAGADVILIPEIRYDIYKVSKKIMERKNAGKSFSIVLAAEGAKPAETEDTSDGNSEIKACANVSFIGTGVGTCIAEEIQKLTAIETTVTVLGHLQKGGRPVTFDRILSTRYGVAAVELAGEEQFGRMVMLQGRKIASVSLKEAAGVVNTVIPDNEMVRIAKSIGVVFGD